MLIAALCGLYETEVAALSKLNLARKILAMWVKQSRVTRRLQTCKRSNRQRGSLAASQPIDLHKAAICVW